MAEGENDFEFTPGQNRMFLDFATKLKATATAAWICALAALLSVLPVALEARWTWVVLPIALAVYLGWVGRKTRHAAADLEKIATTTGADVEHLMHAMADLHALYRLKMYLVLIFMAAVLMLALAGPAA